MVVSAVPWSGLAIPALMVAALSGAGQAAAAPADPGCATTLTAPQVIDVSGTAMVSASASPGACNRAAPQLQVACLQLVGSTVAPVCVQAEGPGTARVNFAPYTPGASYVATGRSCANAGSPPVTFCRSAGPLTATL
ncbi:hypothetical protein C6A86_015065 [Mycobacterium sp. ITM-2016-00316]|uniref:hypothetical protein n=1 Tax=Mycobacterium sp. ITM-2016-00316 TaxID=2099695 RepID=UPI001E3204A1|nr:hypothetical protein [Mycobacterium sp. ITM-2016-00316]WNG79626.1 hypothetical protein C6A86_015065 [Mycobacterium sp. ITM-2016-00316]